MCGIVGAIGGRNIVPSLLEGLRRLEYRGYDSAGLAVINGKLQRLRSAGRVAELERRARARGLNGEVGIAHTRWATHGAPSERNAHPHVSGGVSVVHNGIVENHEDLRAKLRAEGYAFDSDTDTEAIAHLVHSKLRSGDGLFEAVRRSMAELAGAYAIAVISEAEPSRMVVARNGAPLLLGIGRGENFAASDASALVRATRRMIYLEDGDCAEITASGIRIADARGEAVQRPVRVSDLTAESVELGPYRHYMQKEILEQPAAVADTLEAAIGANAVMPGNFGNEAEDILRNTSCVLVLACGTSYHAGLVARHWLETIAGIPAIVEIASEYRYRETSLNRDALVVAISQSGETADTIAALEHAKSLGHRHSLAICNARESALVRATGMQFITRAGPEIGVASTKAFTTQLAALVLLAASIAKLLGRLPREEERKLVAALRNLPGTLSTALQLGPQLETWAGKFARKSHALFLGRGIHYPIAMEGALKLKEISYIHAEAYAAGELKHGPLALVDRDMPVIAIAPRNALFDKLKSNLQEVRARGGELYVLADQDAQVSEGEGVQVIRVPGHAGLLSPVLHTIPLQLLAYHTAIARGNDVDKPRNLAKSVTVE
ncbi:MAG TPA: glutamine--fructose-6-phosphate transaminase (isomerizing) [Burkholderiales bacterium]|nr:glutamine--fructose-6-phosphate transaminase (isomerizing) [Burkholderiales bacterium]